MFVHVENDIILIAVFVTTTEFDLDNVVDLILANPLQN